MYYGDRIFTGAYVNDSWKATPHLTVNIGLRYEYQTVPYSETLQTRNAVSNVPGLIEFQKPTAMKTAWMPRVGLAYSPGTSGKTSIRAGFGRSFDVLVDNFGILTLPPQANTSKDLTGLDLGGFMAGGGIAPNATAGRNTERLNPTNNFDVTFAKSVNFKENAKFEFGARFFNVFNHPQYVGGYLRS